MGSNYNQLKQLLVDSIVQVCQQQSFYIDELKVEGTLCLTSDGASVLVTQITEKIGEKDIGDMLPLRMSSDQNDNKLNIVRTEKESQPHVQKQAVQNVENLENLTKDQSEGSCWKAQPRLSSGYKCPFCKSVYRFRQRLKDHLNKHTGKKAYTCRHCSVKFTHLSGLCAHTRKQHSKRGMWSNKCPLCKDCFFSHKLLRQHFTWKHKSADWTHLLPRHSWLGKKIKPRNTLFSKVEEPCHDSEEVLSDNPLLIDESAPVDTSANTEVPVESDNAENTSSTCQEQGDGNNVLQLMETNQQEKSPAEKITEIIDQTESPADKDKPADLPVERRGPTTRSHTAQLTSKVNQPAAVGCKEQEKSINNSSVPENVKTDGLQEKALVKVSEGVLEPGQVGTALTIPPALAANMMAQASINQAMAMQMGGIAGLWPSLGPWLTQSPAGQSHQAQVIQTPTPAPNVPPSPQPPTTTHPPNSPVASVVASVDQVAAVLSEVRKDLTTGKFPCPYCNKSYRYKHTLKDHLNNHTGMRPHVCDICGSSFIHLASLCAHIKRLHSNEHIGDFKCPACKQAFRKMASLKQHITWQHKEMQTSTMFDNLLEVNNPESPKLSPDFTKTLTNFNLSRFNLDHTNFTSVASTSQPNVPVQPQRYSISSQKINEMAINMITAIPQIAIIPDRIKQSEPPQTVVKLAGEVVKEQPETNKPKLDPKTQEKVEKVTDDKSESDDEMPEQPVPQFYRDWAHNMQSNVEQDCQAATAYVSPNEPGDDIDADGAPSSTVIAQYFEEIEINTPQGMFRYKCKLCAKMYRHRTSVYDHINTHLNKKPYVCRECGDAFAHHSSLFNHTKNKHA